MFSSSGRSRLKERRLKLGLTLEEVGNKVGVTKSTVTKWENGNIENMRRDKISLLAKALDTTPEFIMGIELGLVKEDTPIYETNNKIPLIGSIACGTPILAEENIEQYYAIDSSIKADFCLKTKGKSMINAGIDEGTIVFIKKVEEVENGQIAAVLINEEATLKRIYKTENSIILQSENPDFLPIILTEDIKILGKLVAFTKYL